jgi:hypothetical protein
MFSDISYDIFHKRSQPEYAGIDMMHMPCVHSNISVTARLDITYSQFHSFFRHCSSPVFFVSQMVSLIILLKNKGYTLKILLKRTRALLNKVKFYFGISMFRVL